MDYVDHNPIARLSWEREQERHLKKLKAIRRTQGDRIDNVLSSFHFHAPCRKDKKDRRVLGSVKGSNFNSMKEIRNRSGEKKTVERFENICAYSTLSKRFKSAGSIQRKLSPALNKITGNISVEKLERDFLRSQSIKKRISKPHVEKRDYSIRKRKVKRKLLEIPFINLLKVTN